MTKLEQMENTASDISRDALRYANTLTPKQVDRFYIMLITEFLASIEEYDIIDKLEKKYKVVRHGW